MKYKFKLAKRSSLAICLLFAIYSSVEAQSIVTGRYAAPFLNISPYARQVAMGEAFTALANDINVMRYNIGGLGNLRHIMLSTHFHNWIDDTQQGALEVALPWRYGVAGFNLTYFNEGKLAEVDENFNSTGNTLESNDLVFSFGYGYYLQVLGNTLSFGAGAKLIRQNLAGESASGTGVDVGMLYSLKNFSLGATLQNLTVSKIRFINREYLLPETVRGGVAVRLPIGSKFKLSLDTDIAKYVGSADDKLRIYSGGELRISEVFAVRGGYKFHNTELSRWGAGFGVIIPMNWFGRSLTELDYAYSPMDAFDTQAHRFSLSFTFGKVEPVGQVAGVDTEEMLKMREQVARELESAAQARKEAEEARLAAQETEKRLKDLEKEMAARQARAKQIADSSGGKIEVKPVEEGNIIPEFPWPPPSSSASVLLEEDKFHFRKSRGQTYQKDVSRRLNAALDAAGYLHKRSYYLVPNGFALATQPEQIDVNGNPKLGQRWVLKADLPIFSLEYLKTLFTGQAGHYRVFVFIVTSVSIYERKKTISFAEASEWAGGGGNKLPNIIGDSLYTSNHSCTAFIYEFEREDIIKSSPLTAYDHLEGGNLLLQLEKSEE